MRSLIIGPWDTDALNQIVALQKHSAFALMTVQEELDYVEEFNPKDWFMLKSRDGQIHAFVRHFPHFSTHSWVQFQTNSLAADADVEILWQNFSKHAFLEEADGFRVFLQGPDVKFKNLFVREGFSVESSRKWRRHRIEGKVQMPSWQKVDAFKAAMMFTEDDSFLTTQKLSPFQSKTEMYLNEETSEVIRFEKREDVILLIGHTCQTGKSLWQGVCSVAGEQRCENVWTVQEFASQQPVQQIQEITLIKDV